MPTEPSTPTAHRYQEPVDAHLILRRGNEVLLARRAGSPYANGLLNCVSGHVDGAFEDIVTTLVREAQEEAGIDVDPADVRAAVVVQHLNPYGAQRTGWFFEVTRWKGEPRICEPTLCTELGFFPLDRLPDDMVAYCRAGLDAYRNGQHIALHRQEPGDPIAYLPGGPDRTRYLRLSTPDPVDTDLSAPRDQRPSHQTAEKREPPANGLFGVAVIVHDTITDAVLMGESARFPGLIEAVGGKPDPGEDLRATAAREVAEETGLIADPADVQLHAMVVDQRGGCRGSIYSGNRPSASAVPQCLSSIPSWSIGSTLGRSTWWQPAPAAGGAEGAIRVNMVALMGDGLPGELGALDALGDGLAVRLPGRAGVCVRTRRCHRVPCAPDSLPARLLLCPGSRPGQYRRRVPL